MYAILWNCKAQQVFIPFHALIFERVTQSWKRDFFVNNYY